MHSPFWPPVDLWQEGKQEKYRAVLEAMDTQLAVLFEHIQNNKELAQNTLILICSDNGPEPGAGSAGPFSGIQDNALRRWSSIATDCLGSQE